MYANKQIDHEKRKNQEGSYSVYNYMYRYLMDNYEPKNFESSYACEATERLLIKYGKAYCKKGGNKISDEELKQHARDAVTNFIHNNKEHGDTAHNFGKRQNETFENIKNTINDLKY